MSRLFIVSNRLPFSVEETEDGMVVRQSSGGLVSALKSYFEYTGQQPEQFSEKLWIGSVDVTEGTWQTVNEESQLPDSFTIEPVFPDKEIYSAYYNGFSNSSIWPLFHYFPSVVQFRKEHFDAYRSINQLFAERIVQLYQPSDVIWVHDYQLLLLPQLLREKLPNATIGFFCTFRFRRMKFSGCCQPNGTGHFTRHARRRPRGFSHT